MIPEKRINIQVGLFSISSSWSGRMYIYFSLSQDGLLDKL
jgi:hypothetical protein